MWLNGRQEDDAFWNYFQRRGGVRTFGYPTSRMMTLEGFLVQFFQRQVMQLRADGSVQLLNLLDPSILPYTKINGSTFPAYDQVLSSRGPSPSDPQYADKAIAFVHDQILLAQRLHRLVEIVDAQANPVFRLFNFCQRTFKHLSPLVHHGDARAKLLDLVQQVRR